MMVVEARRAASGVNVDVSVLHDIRLLHHFDESLALTLLLFQSLLHHGNGDLEADIRIFHRGCY